MGNINSTNLDKGRHGEHIAGLYLIRNGYEIVQTNYRVKSGEIDIIARSGEYIVFVEVKYRKGHGFAYPREYVDIHKQGRIKKAAMHYILSEGLDEACFRFDVIEVTGVGEFKVEHLMDAFQ